MTDPTPEDVTNIAALTKARATKKGMFTKCLTRLDNAILNPAESYAETAPVNALVDQLTEYNASMMRTHNELIGLLIDSNFEPDKLTTYQKWSDAPQDQFDNIMKRVTTYLKRAFELPRPNAEGIINPPPAPPVPPHPIAGGGPLGGGAAGGDPPGGAGPPLAAIYDTRPVFQLTPPPVYDPDIHDYTRFRTRWDQYIGARPDLSNGMKMAELVGRVDGEAYQAIYGYGYDGANYNAALDELAKRFGDVTILTAKYMARIRNAAPVKELKAKPLQRLHDILKTNSDNLRNSGHELKAFQELDAWLAKCPQKIRSSLAREKVNNPGVEVTIPRFLEILQREVLVQKALEISEETADRPEEENTNAKKAIAAAAAAAASNTSGENKGANKTETKNQNSGRKQNEKKRPLLCMCCDEKHRTDTCGEFLKLTPQERFKLIKDAKGCIFCIMSNHKSRECSMKDKTKCGECELNHNTLLCFESAKKDSKKSATAAAAAKPAKTNRAAKDEKSSDDDSGDSSPE